jgi:uncharacterized membrane protein YeaQ/YmgE (transglycosylase-associated protein family)
MESLGIYLFAGLSVVRRRLPDRCTQSRTHLYLPRPRGLAGQQSSGGTKNMLSILWTILIGFIAGVIAKLVTPGSTYEPQGFILTAALGIVGALVATYLGQALGWYQAGQGAGFIGSIVGAALILLVWGFIASRRA